MKFILICATIGDRLNEIKDMIDSLENQSYQNWKLIIVHQEDLNKNKLKSIAETNEKIEYYNIEKKGLSLARNYGLSKVYKNYKKNSAIIGFPDDDCKYLRDTLNLIYKTIETNSLESFIFQFGEINEAQKPILCRISKDLIGKSPSVGIYYRNSTEVYFNENLGLGTKFASCEDTDFTRRLKKIGYMGFTKNMLIYHKEDNIENYDVKKYEKAMYGIGGYLCNSIVKDKDFYQIIILIKIYIKQIGGIILGSKKGRKYHKNALRMLFIGFRNFKKELEIK